MTAEVIQAVNDLAADVKARLQAFEGRMDRFEERGLRRQDPAAPCNRALLDALEKSGTVKALIAKESKTGVITLPFTAKSIIGDSPGGSPNEGYPVPRERVDGIFSIQRPLDLLDVLESLAMEAGNVAEFVRLAEDAGQSAAAVQTAEGAAKAEETYAFTLDSATVETVAVYATASTQVLADVPALASFLQSDLAFKINARDEALTLATLAAAATAYSASATSDADRIGQALASLRARVNAPLIAVLNPPDWFGIQSERASGTGEYVNGGGWSNPANGPLWGAGVVATSSQAAGTALVLARNAVRRYVRMQTTIDVGVTGSQFTSNLRTILAENRRAVAVLQPSLVLSVSI